MFVASTSRCSEVEKEKVTEITDAAFPENTNLSTLGTPGLKIVISLSLITRERRVLIDSV